VGILFAQACHQTTVISYNKKQMPITRLVSDAGNYEHGTPLLLDFLWLHVSE
jgi:hypothetical protein